MMHFQLMHESLARFSESFASFMYGLNMNAFCVDFPEVCILFYGRDQNSKLIINARVRFQSHSVGTERKRSKPQFVLEVNPIQI